MRSILFFGLAMVAQPAMGRAACPTPDLLQQPARSFAEIFQPGDASEPKGEFETSAAYAARQAAAPKPGQSVLRVQLDPESLTYDADTQAFQYFEYALSPIIDFAHLTGLTPDQKTLFDGAERPVALMVSQERRDAGSYEAENAYGAKTTVAKWVIDKHVVFEARGRKGPTGDTLLNEHRRYEPRSLSVRVPIDRAAALKTELSGVALVTPKAPYYATGSEFMAATRTSPTENTVQVSILFADIQCFGIMDGAGTLLAHWATR